MIWDTPLVSAISDARRVLRAVESLPVTLDDGQQVFVTVSAGLASWPVEGDARSREEALALAYEEADRALYQAKAQGRNRLRFSSPGAAAA